MDLSISLSNYPSSNHHYTSSCVTTTNEIVSPLSNSNHDPSGQSIQYLELLPHGPCYNNNNNHNHNQITQYAPNDLSNNNNNDYTLSQLMPNTTADPLKLGNLMAGKNPELIYSKSPNLACKNRSMNIISGYSSYTIDVNEVPITKNASNSSEQTCNHTNYNSNSSVEMMEACDGNSNNTIKYTNDSANSHAGSMKKRRLVLLAGHEDRITQDYGHAEEEIYEDQEGMISDRDEADEEIYNANYAVDQGGAGVNSNSGGGGRKKLRLSKQQSALLEESFRRHSTLNPKQKNGLAKQLDLSARQVEVWFQNRRARTKLKQTEADCELLKRCCESLTAENRRLRSEVAELRALSRHAPPPPAPPVTSYHPHVHLPPPDASYPSSRDGGGGGGGVLTGGNPNRRRRHTAAISDHQDHTAATTAAADNRSSNNHVISHFFPALPADQQLLLLFQPPPPPPPPPPPSCAA